MWRVRLMAIDETSIDSAARAGCSFNSSMLMMNIVS